MQPVGFHLQEPIRQVLGRGPTNARAPGRPLRHTAVRHVPHVAEGNEPGLLRERPLPVLQEARVPSIRHHHQDRPKMPEPPQVGREVGSIVPACLVGDVEGHGS